MSEQAPSQARSRPFPWLCIECRAKEVFPTATDYTTTVTHDGRSYTIRVPELVLPTCRNCGDQLFTADADDRVVAALRAQIGLLTPDEIQQRRAALNVTQEEVAEQIGVAKEALLGWETGALIQSRVIDNLMRLFFESEEARGLLARRFRPKSAISA
jgi:putative zinc finger/helix-turn-helix YgiT family protein